MRDDGSVSDRRPIPVRKAAWAVAIAGWLTRRGVRPNLISILSVLFALFAALGIAAGIQPERAVRAACFGVSILCILLRLLCNLLDGMVAIEGGKGTKSGGVYNELPDRISDAVILVSAGYAAREVSCGVALGWAAALLAVITAYVRTLAGSLGAPQRFVGPMAKQERMAVIGAALAFGMATGVELAVKAIAGALAVVAAGCLVTIARRTLWLIRDLSKT